MAFDGNMSDRYQQRPLLLHGHSITHGPKWQYDWDFTTASDGIEGYLHQAVPLHPQVFRGASLHCDQTIPLLFLFYILSLYLLIISGSHCGWATW